MTLICPQCGQENDTTALYCSVCGAELAYGEPTPVFLRATDLKKSSSNVLTESVGLYGAPAKVELLIEGYPALTVTLTSETTLGRGGACVDLTDYQAGEKGVSRLHAVIRNQGNILTLADLNSTNGTTLNGELLLPGKQRIIKSNDEIQLGKLVLRVQFSL